MNGSLCSYFTKLNENNIEPEPRNKKQKQHDIVEEGSSLFVPEDDYSETDMRIEGEMAKSERKSVRRKEKKGVLLLEENNEDNEETTKGKKKATSKKKATGKKKAKNNGGKEKTKATNKPKLPTSAKLKIAKQNNNANSNERTNASVKCRESNDCDCDLCATLLNFVAENSELCDIAASSSSTSSPIDVDAVVVAPKSRKRKKRKLDNPNRDHSKPAAINNNQPKQSGDAAIVRLRNNSSDNSKITVSERIRQYPLNTLEPWRFDNTRLYCKACASDFNVEPTTVKRHVEGARHIKAYVLYYLSLLVLIHSLPKYNQVAKEREAFQQHFANPDNAPPIGNGATLSSQELSHRAYLVKTFFEAGIPLSKIKEYVLLFRMFVSHL